MNTRLPIVALVIALFVHSAGFATTLGASPEIGEFTKSMTRNDGFFTFYTDTENGKVWLQVPEERGEFLYADYLSSGLGSNPIGLDRGKPGRTRLVYFARIGAKVLLFEKNVRFRATTDDPSEARAVADSFPPSVLWSGTVAAESEGSYLIDLTSLVVSDVHGVVETLEGAGQGQYRVDLDRSAIYLPRTKAFPENCEFEALLTFSSTKPGRMAAAMSPDPNSVTLREHHSFIKLPDDGFQPRAFDPRSGGIPLGFYDYGVALDQSVARRYVIRHRLVKKEPSLEISEPVEPIVYYVDPGAPEPIRSALIEGASWWNAAFEAAGFRNAFQVRVLPPEADPLDVRYNVIQWVHRSTRGWSYGMSVTDPRTGEIIKGHVSLGSLRVRQDEMIFRGLNPVHSVAENGLVACAMAEGPVPEVLAQADGTVVPVDVALARIRQLSAHEVGHTLGFTHNFAASTFGRASVMDYPAPWVKVTENEALDFSEAYAAGIGPWDKASVEYSYRQFSSNAEESQGLSEVIRRALDEGMYIVSDQDARPAGAAHPYANLWDNGSSPISELTNVLNVRKVALARMGEGSIALGDAYAELKRLFVPVYLYHRYQVNAVVKLVGGVEYRYAMRGDGQTIQKPVAGELQRNALNVLLGALNPDQLTIEDRLINLLAPEPVGFYGPDRELLDSRSAMIFDSQSAVEVAARLVVAGLLQPERGARLIELNLRDPSLPSLQLVIDKLFQQTWYAPPLPEGSLAGTARTVESVVLDELMSLAANQRASVSVRSVAESKLWELRENLAVTGQGGSELENSHFDWAIAEIDRFLNRDYSREQLSRPMETPPGDPIGG